MKRPYSVGYFSSYDRGLRCLLEIWPEVLAQVPKANLHIYYGWNLYDKMHSSNPDMMKKKWEMVRMMHDPSIKDHGRVSHKELAEAMKELKVWAYPTEFTEINCITALKAQEADMIPVTTARYALETSIINHQYSVPCSDIYTNKDRQKQFINSLVRALKTKDYISTKSDDWQWPNVAQKWHGILQ